MNQLAPADVNKFYPMFWRLDDDIGSGYNCNMSYKCDTGFDWDGKAMDFPSGTNRKGLSIRRGQYRNGWDVVV